MSVECSVQQGQEPCLPEGIAAIHQLVAATLKSSFKSHLPACHPLLRRNTGEAGVRQRHSSQGQSLGGTTSGVLASLLLLLFPKGDCHLNLAILKQPAVITAQSREDNHHFSYVYVYILCLLHCYFLCFLSPPHQACSLPLPK